MEAAATPIKQILTNDSIILYLSVIQGKRQSLSFGTGPFAIHRNSPLILTCVPLRLTASHCVSRGLHVEPYRGFRQQSVNNRQQPSTKLFNIFESCLTRRLISSDVAANTKIDSWCMWLLDITRDTDRRHRWNRRLEKGSLRHAKHFDEQAFWIPRKAALQMNEHAQAPD